MKRLKTFAILFFCVISIAAAQAPTSNSTTPEPPLPVVDYKACPFEGCTFGRWIVSKDVALYSTWRKGRETVTTVKKGQVVTGITGVHITYQPDRVQVSQSMPDLGLKPGDIILVYMYLGEGFADMWAKGRWLKGYDCSFITEMNAACLRDCPANVISKGVKEWWVQVKTSDGLTGWTKVVDQFDCMDSLGGDPKCDALQSPSNSPR
jgi:hypothetical protein